MPYSANLANFLTPARGATPPDPVSQHGTRFGRGRSGFTLVELMISVAIIVILTAMIFGDFNHESSRNALKSAVHQLQTDLQGMQANAQGGVLTDGVAQSWYGVHVQAKDHADSDTQGFAVFAAPTLGAKNVLVTRTFTSEVFIRYVNGNSGDGDITFQVPSGKAVLSTGGSTMTIVIESPQLNTCYAITVTADVGTVSQRQLSSCSL